MHPLKTTSAALAGTAVLLLVAVQFAPWADFESSASMPGFDYGFGASPGFEFDIQMTAFTWYAKTTFNGDSDSTGWYDDDVEGDGVGQVRTAIPVLLVGTVVLLIGALVGATRPDGIGGIVALVGAVLVAVATILFATGLNLMFEDVDYTWGVSFYFAIAAGVLGLVAGILALAAGQRQANTAF